MYLKCREKLSNGKLNYSGGSFELNSLVNQVSKFILKVNSRLSAQVINTVDDVTICLHCKEYLFLFLSATRVEYLIEMHFNVCLLGPI